MFRSTLIAAAAALVATVVQPALAAAPASAPSRTVYVADLNLGSTAGRATLDSRLRFAAKAVCEIGNGRTTLSETVAAQSCYRKALNAARNDYAARDKAGTLEQLGG